MILPSSVRTHNTYPPCGAFNVPPLMHYLQELHSTQELPTDQVPALVHQESDKVLAVSIFSQFPNSIDADALLRTHRLTQSWFQWRIQCATGHKSFQ
jgi:hypothetical protein